MHPSIAKTIKKKKESQDVTVRKDLSEQVQLLHFT